MKDPTERNDGSLEEVVEPKGKRTGGKFGVATGPSKDSPNLHDALEGGLRIGAADVHGDPFPLPRAKQLQLQTELAMSPGKAMQSLHMRLMDEAIKP